MKLLRVVGLAAATITAAFVSSSADAKTLRWGAVGDVTSMDPYAFYTTLNSGFLQNIYEPLLRYDRNLKYEPSLATSWERVEPTVWRFHLRKGVKFHNGNDFNADDVVASLLRASHPNSPYITATSQIETVRKVDDHTVDVVLKGKYPLILNDLAGVFIMDKEWMEQNNTLQPVNPSKGEESFATRNANGTGPFMLKSRRPDAETVLTINSNWWDKREHNLDEVIYRPIRLDATRVAALLSGELDLVIPAPLQDIDRIRGNPALDALVGHDLRVMMFGLNQGAAKLNNSNIKDRNPFADIRVREALTRAIDRETLSRRVMRGLAKPTSAIVAPEIQGWDASLNQDIAPYDADRAKKLLAEAGYPDGFEVGMDCPNDQYVNPELICQAAASMWARIGVKVNLTAQPTAPYTRKMLNGEADIYLIGWANTPQLNAFAILNNVIRKGGRYNPGGYDNAKVNDLVGQIATELDDGKRLGMTVEALSLQKKDFAMVPLQQDPLVWAIRKGVQVPLMADNKVRLWHVRMD